MPESELGTAVQLLAEIAADIRMIAACVALPIIEADLKSREAAHAKIPRCALLPTQPARSNRGTSWAASGTAARARVVAIPVETNDENADGK